MKKLDILKNTLTQHAAAFRCPLCFSGLNITGNTLACANGHCYDLSAKGRVHMAAGGREFYDGGLFAARKAAFAQGFFAPLYAAINACASNQGGLWLDAGCGEGSGLRSAGAHADLRVGIDLSKEGIRLASAGDSDGFVWVVGDLANLPLADDSVNVILNVLSPANYAEFDRVRKPDGVLIKVIPGAHYLQELRRAFFKGSAKERHSAYPTAEAFQAVYPNARITPVTYTVEAAPGLLRPLLAMTPLLQNVAEAEKQAFAESGIRTVTADYLILVSGEAQ